MITKEEILENITGSLVSDNQIHVINIPIGWIHQAMQQYAEEYHKEKMKEISVDFYLWMQKNEYNHNIKSRVEKRFNEFINKKIDCNCRYKGSKIVKICPKCLSEITGIA